MDTIEVKNNRMGVDLTMVKEEQSKILNSFYELENRYKEILEENK